MPGPQDLNIKPKTEPGITIKQEPLASTSKNFKDLKGSLEALRLGSSRLPSFRGPRDLTLSAPATLQPQARPKKTFLPNIPVRREKGEKLTESKSERSIKKSPDKFRHDRGRGRGKGRGREREFVQTRGSLFGEGIAASTFIKRSQDHGGYQGGGSRSSEMQKPVLNPDAAYNIDKDLEEKRLKEILRDDFIDYPDDEDIDTFPVELPLLSKEGKTFKTEPKAEVKLEKNLNCASANLDAMDVDIGVRVKQEPGLEKENVERTSPEVPQPEIAVDQASYYPEDSVAYSLLSCGEKDAICLRLPTCLPGLPPEVRPEERQTASSGSSSTTSNPRSQSHGVLGGIFSTPRCTLDTLPEGKVGDLRVRESGKVELCIGDHVYIVNKAVPPVCLQKCVKIDVDTKNKTGNMTVLRHVKDRLSVEPDFEAMINNIRKKS